LSYSTKRAYASSKKTPQTENQNSADEKKAKESTKEKMLIAKITATLLQASMLLQEPAITNKPSLEGWSVVLQQVREKIQEARKPLWRKRVEILQANAGIGNPDKYPEYLDIITKIHYDTGFPPEILCALIHRETHWRNFVGDNGNGFGLTQIDRRSHSTWLANNDWRNPDANIRYSLQEIQEYFNKTGCIRQALASYNAGPFRVARAVKNGKCPDAPTTGGNYSSHILQIAKNLGWTENKLPPRIPPEKPGKPQ
jgi:soluble lytic murein transglycosylase-like protein